jgi:hypothetical protein
VKPLTRAATMTPGVQLIIVASSKGVNGPFADLPDGAIVAVDGDSFCIKSTPADVTLTALAPVGTGARPSSTLADRTLFVIGTHPNLKALPVTFRPALRAEGGPKPNRPGRVQVRWPRQGPRALVSNRKC